MTNSTKKSLLVLGAGAGIGGHTAKRFATEGYHAVVCRRSNADGLSRLVQDIENIGGTAEGRLLNLAEPDAIESLVADIEQSAPPIHSVLYNLGAQIGTRSLDQTSAKQFELGWRMATFGLFRLAKAVFPAMVDRGQGTLLVTSATASVRGNAGQHSHAAAMGGRRMLCQSLNAEFAQQGIHVAHVLIDGAVDAPDTLGKMLGPERFEALREQRGKAKDGLLLPEQIAETFFHVAHQHRSAWTHELDLRAHSDLAWWNHEP